MNNGPLIVGRKNTVLAPIPAGPTQGIPWVMKITNLPFANQYLTEEYRPGFGA